MLINIIFACSRLPKGVSNIMAIDESEEEYNHVVRVLLDTAIDSPIDLLLRAVNCTSIARLRQLIKIPGLLDLSNEFRLNDDQYEDLQAIESYINWAHNASHSDITTRTRGCFDTFFENKYDVNNPIVSIRLQQGTASPIILPSGRTIFRSLVDRGVGTGTAGSDMRTTPPSGRSQATAVPDIDTQSPGSYGTVVRTQKGPVVLVFNQYARQTSGPSVHSCLQLEDNHVKVEDQPLTLGGNQRLYTTNRYAIPLDVINRRFHLNSRPFTDVEWRTLLHVHITRHDSWSPTLVV
jgi:hypothetical protein